MKWALTLTGTHAEGLEAKARFDKIVAEFSDRLYSNGFLPGYTDRTVDLDGELTPVTLEVSNPPVAREAAKLTHAPHAFVEPPREVLDKWVEEDALKAGPTPPVEGVVEDVESEYVAGFEAIKVEDVEAKPVNVIFASDEAGELAIARGLTTRNFQGIVPSGASGFTVPDVKKAAKRAGK